MTIWDSARSLGRTALRGVACLAITGSVAVVPLGCASDQPSSDPYATQVSKALSTATGASGEWAMDPPRKSSNSETAPAGDPGDGGQTTGSDPVPGAAGAITDAAVQTAQTGNTQPVGQAQATQGPVSCTETVGECPSWAPHYFVCTAAVMPAPGCIPTGELRAINFGVSRCCP